MLSNAYFLAKFRFDTAENEPAKNLPILPILNFANFANPNGESAPRCRRSGPGRAADTDGDRRGRAPGARPERVPPRPAHVLTELLALPYGAGPVG